MNGSWKKGSRAVLIFKSDAALNDFTSVLVDGTFVDSANYALGEGSTVVTLKAPYLETLAVGTHTITIRSKNGDASTEFIIQEKEVSETKPKEEQKNETAEKNETAAEDKENVKNNSPKTGDSMNLALWIVLLIGSASVIITLAVYKIKMKKSKRYLYRKTSENIGDIRCLRWIFLKRLFWRFDFISKSMLRELR